MTGLGIHECAHDLSHLYSDCLEEHFLRSSILLRHEQAVPFVDECLSVVAVVLDGHICVDISVLEVA